MPMQTENEKRHNDDMSEMHHDDKPVLTDEKPALEEDAKIARILGLVLFVVVPVFGFYYGSVFGKEWHFDYRLVDVYPSLMGAAIGFVIALFMNAWIWFKYKPNMDRDMNFEWYEPQSHRSGDHH